MISGMQEISSILLLFTVLCFVEASFNHNNRLGNTRIIVTILLYTLQFFIWVMILLSLFYGKKGSPPYFILCIAPTEFLYQLLTTMFHWRFYHVDMKRFIDDEESEPFIKGEQKILLDIPDSMKLHSRKWNLGLDIVFRSALFVLFYLGSSDYTITYV
jgi:hypothetical protein